MVARTNDHKVRWKLWSVQLNAVSGALATTVGAAAMMDMPKVVVVGVAAAILLVNALNHYVRTIVQSGLLEAQDAQAVRSDQGQAGS